MTVPKKEFDPNCDICKRPIAMDLDDDSEIECLFQGGKTCKEIGKKAPATNGGNRQNER